MLGGADAIVFGGGIGERSAVIRARICEAWTGAVFGSIPCAMRRLWTLLPATAMKISEEEAPLACYVAGVDEEMEIARATLDCVLNRSPSVRET